MNVENTSIYGAKTLTSQCPKKTHKGIRDSYALCVLHIIWLANEL